MSSFWGSLHTATTLPTAFRTTTILGINTYTYDSVNWLVSVTSGSTLSAYTFNGLGDRLSRTVNGIATNYSLNTGLTQVLDDGTNTYCAFDQTEGAALANCSQVALNTIREML